MSYLQKKAAAQMRVLFSLVMICVGVPWLPSLCATDYIYHPIYKLYSNDVVAIDAGAEASGWAEYYIPNIPKQVWLYTRSTQGNYPRSLDIVITQTHNENTPPFCEGEWWATLYTLTGKISAAVVKYTPVTTYTVNIHIHVESYINEPHDGEDHWVLQNVTNNQETYNHHFFCDDFSDGPADTTNVGTLAVQATWSANNGWTDGHLQAEETWDSYYHMPADVDVFRVDTTKGVYCVETEKQIIDFDSALIVSVFKKQADANAYDGDYIARTNKFNVYGDHGYIDNVHQRVYFTLDNDNGAYVQISLADPSKASNYKVRVFRARPVILVHGIESNPKTATDPLSTMGHYKLAAPYDSALMPAVIYDFPWNSETENIGINSNEGLPLSFIQYVDDVYTKQDMPVVLIGHSMGGYLCRHYMATRTRTYWDWCFLLGSPQYGSDIANSPLLDVLNYYFGHTSGYNLDALKRGSEHSWTMHKWIGNIDSHVVCVAGHRNAGYAMAHLITSYKRGLAYSDGIVPVSSANLRSVSSQVTFYQVYMNHHRIGVFTDNEENQNPQNTFQDDVYKIIKDYLD